MSNDTKKLAKLVSAGKAVGAFTTLSVSAMALIGGAGLVFFADLWMPKTSPYALQTEKQVVENQISLKEHNYLLGCLAYFPTETGLNAAGGETFFSTQDGTTLESLNSLGEKPQQIPFNSSDQKAKTKVNQPLVAAVRTAGSSTFTGNSLVTATLPTLRGITSVPCKAASNHHWFVAGSTEVGESTYLSIFNPGDTPTQVTIQGWSSTSAFTQKPTLTVGARSLQVVNAATYFPGEERIGLHVNASGPGAVVALHSFGESGLATRGLETVSSVEEASSELIFPGVLGNLTDLRIRILNPHSEPVAATLEIADVTGSRPVAGTEEIEIAGSAVFELDLNGLGEGQKTLILRGKKSLLANIIGVAEGGDKEDAKIIAERVIWTPVTAIKHLRTQLPPLQNGEKNRALSLYNPGETAIKVAVNGQEVQVPKQAQISFEITGEMLELAGENPFYSGLIIKRIEGKTTMLTNLQLLDPQTVLPTLRINFQN